MISWGVGAAVVMRWSLANAPAPAPDLTATQVHELIDAKGARGAVAQLFDSDAHEMALANGIGTGESEWLRVAQRLRPGSDAASGEILCTAVQEALPKNPAGVLSLVHQGAFSVENACAMYGFGQIEDERPVPVLLGLVDVRVRAVESVRSAELALEREACLGALRKLREVLQSR